MSSKQVCNTLVEDCPRPSETLGQDGQDYQNCPWKKKVRSVEWYIQNTALHSSVHSRRWQQKGHKISRRNISSLHSSSSLACWSVFSCTVRHQCRSCTLSLNITSTPARSVLPSHSPLTFLCLFVSVLFTYLGARKRTNILVVTSSWSCTSSCPWWWLTRLSVSLLLMYSLSALIY